MTESKVSKALIYPCIAALGLAYCSDRPTDIATDRVISTSENIMPTTVYAPQNRPDVRGQIGAVSAGILNNKSILAKSNYSFGLKRATSEVVVSALDVPLSCCDVFICN